MTTQHQAVFGAALPAALHPVRAGADFLCTSTVSTEDIREAALNLARRVQGILMLVVVIANVSLLMIPLAQAGTELRDRLQSALGVTSLRR